MKSICVHTLVKNEEKYLWFSVMSVINYVDKILMGKTQESHTYIKIKIRTVKSPEPGDKVASRSAQSEA